MYSVPPLHLPNVSGDSSRQPSPREEKEDSSSSLRVLQKAQEDSNITTEEIKKFIKLTKVQPDMVLFVQGFWEEFIKQLGLGLGPEKEDENEEKILPTLQKNARSLTALKFELDYNQLTQPTYSGLILLLLVIFAAVNFCVQNLLTALAPRVPKWLACCFKEALVKKNSVVVVEELNDSVQNLHDLLLKFQNPQKETETHLDVEEAIERLDDKLSERVGEIIKQSSSSSDEQVTYKNKTLSDQLRHALQPIAHTARVLPPTDPFQMRAQRAHNRLPPLLGLTPSPPSTTAQSPSPPQTAGASPHLPPAERPATAVSPLR